MNFSDPKIPSQIPPFDLIAFDLDNTLAKSKSPLDPEMAVLLSELLVRKKVAIVSGGAWPQFEKQVISQLPCRDADQVLADLYIMPTEGLSLYEYKVATSCHDHSLVDGMTSSFGWQKAYEEDISEAERRQIMDAFDKALAETGMESGAERPPHIYGVLVEDRLSQVTFSGLGSEAPLELKKSWDPDRKKRSAVIEALRRYLPASKFEIDIGGSTSIDVTKKGEDKAYGMRRLSQHLKIPLSKIIYVGDALFRGGNDFSVTTLGIFCISVNSPEDTKILIRKLIGQIA